MWWAFWPGLVILATAAFGPGHEQLRDACNGYMGGVPQEPCATKRLHLEEVRKKSQRALDEELNGAAIEHYDWDAPPLQGPPAKANFTVGIAEFDEQGDAWDPDQVAAVKAALRAALDERNAVVVVFVHGWKNNCESCNGNLKCFRETMALLAATEQRFAQLLKQPAREVFGFYIAWRGASARIEPAKTVSVFSRKATADQLGSSRGGDLTNLLAWVDAQRAAHLPKQASLLGDMFTFLGHSFGADVLFGAVANTLDARLATAGNDLVKSFGDLLVLVNPAFEASAYSRFADAAQKMWQRKEGADPRQGPVMITVQARNDRPTHYALPGSRIITTLGQGSGTRGYAPMITGLGHYKPFYTHDLGPALNAVPLMQQILKTTIGSAPSTYNGVLEAMASKTPGEPSEKCACDKIRANAQTLTTLWQLVQAVAQSSPPGTVQVGDSMPGVASFMRPCQRSTDPQPKVESPFLIVRASADIVDGHSGITQLPFFEFLANFLARVQVLRNPKLYMQMTAAMKSSMVLQTSAAMPACH